ncbi:M15 family metallopeptidase [Yersinia pekkanenii]|uniref:Peptidase M15 family n=1 Tax=Yersinia pekkanenii TaxID=1288385 RepID=A0A0T9RHA9_9GAMM|nr:M15 family metallopeptidase [Yersinia pekkanenii]CNI62800.1 peptidase M15 family [Yersinia pekkanenii]CRY67562.1 peptidase M15 family [Yersinia pekkanenii]
MVNNFGFSKRSEVNLVNVHPALVRVARRAIQLTSVDFTVIEGLRSVIRQRELVSQGSSQTLNSRHLTGHAIDCVPIINGVIPWNDKSTFKAVSDAMFQAAKELGVKIRWGGDWNENGRSDDERFYDGPHFELRRQEYP